MWLRSCSGFVCRGLAGGEAEHGCPGHDRSHAGAGSPGCAPGRYMPVWWSSASAPPSWSGDGPAVIAPMRAQSEDCSKPDGSARSQDRLCASMEDWKSNSWMNAGCTPPEARHSQGSVPVLAGATEKGRQAAAAAAAGTHQRVRHQPLRSLQASCCWWPQTLLGCCSC